MFRSRCSHCPGISSGLSTFLNGFLLFFFSSPHTCSLVSSSFPYLHANKQTGNNLVYIICLFLGINYELLKSSSLFSFFFLHVPSLALPSLCCTHAYCCNSPLLPTSFFHSIRAMLATGHLALQMAGTCCFCHS